jgi:cytochrome c-type biogenesis protein
MLPVYVSYFAGESGGRAAASRNALLFVAGFTVIFTSMGAFAGTLGMLVARHRAAANVISGALVVLFGLNFLGILPFDISSPFKRMEKNGGERKAGAVASFVFGMAFAVLWTPCVGAFLGTALMMASSEETALEGAAMLACYSAGLGLPFLASAVLIDALKNFFGFIKRNYKVINALSGSFLVILGILMMTGLYGRFVI